MDDLPADDLFRQLRSADPQEAWARFLQHYSTLLLDVIHLFEHEADAVGDCYVFVCERLSRDRFRRLLRFRPDGAARFSTWLCAVARNLCLDWHRQQFGRYRVFESVARMPALDREIFRCLFVELLPPEETLLELRRHFPGLTPRKVDEAAGRVRQALTSRQRWLLAVRRSRGAGRTFLVEDDEAAVARIPLDTPDPEASAALREERAALEGAVSHLAAGDRLLIRLRYERELTLEEIARLLDLGTAQAADRRIRDAVGKLRKILGQPADHPGKTPAPSV